MLLLGEPTRIRILDDLRPGERNVQALADGLATTQQNVSGHLRLLSGAGVVARRAAGRERFYRGQPRNAVRRVLEELRDAAIIENRGRADWRVTDPLLARYLADLGPLDGTA